VCQDIRILGVKNWRNVALNREEWRIILRKARAHKRAVVRVMMMMYEMAMNGVWFGFVITTTEFNL
jgi:hypothetical protein